jgi:hypothetical protein
VAADDFGARQYDGYAPQAPRHANASRASAFTICWQWSKRLACVRNAPEGIAHVGWLLARASPLQVETPKHPVGVVRSPLQPEEVRGLTRGGERGSSSLCVASIYELLTNTATDKHGGGIQFGLVLGLRCAVLRCGVVKSVNTQRVCACFTISQRCASLSLMQVVSHAATAHPWKGTEAHLGGCGGC